jgi:hypothetical protein
MNNPLTQDFARKLARLARFSALVEDTFVAQSDALDAELSARGADFSEELRQELFEHYAEDYVELSDELPTILRYSVLTAADTALELYIVETCDTYSELRKERIQLRDLAGGGIKRARKYLEMMAGIELPDQSPSWTAVLGLHKLRNCIVHADGYVGTSRKDLIQLTKSIAGLRITSGGVITLGQQFIEAALLSYERFATDFDLACEPLGLWESVFAFQDPPGNSTPES